MSELKIEVGGAEHEVTVKPDGLFYVQIGRRRLKAETLKELKEKAEMEPDARHPAQRYNIPATLLERSYGVRTVEHGVVVGLHANRNVLFKSDKTGRTEQIGSYRSVWRRLSDAEVGELTRLDAASDAAQEAARKFRDDHQMNVRAEIEKIDKGRG